MTAEPSAHVFQQGLVVNISYPVRFTRGAFTIGNPRILGRRSEHHPDERCKGLIITRGERCRTAHWRIQGAE